MKKIFLILALLSFGLAFSQDNEGALKGTVVNTSDDAPLDNVHVLNLNQVIGTITNEKGEFNIPARANDTLYLSYLGFKSIKVRVTNDMLKYQNTKIGLTELAYALEEVVVRPFQLTGYLDIDAKNIPINESARYSISGLNVGYEAGSRNPNAFAKVMGSIFNPADFLHNLFGKKPKQMRKLRKMQEDDKIRNLLASKFDRETLMALLQVDKVDIEEILRNCNYSDSFIETANDLQILDAISNCYEEYKVLNRGN
ncbi:carboxypeptidase-like regulatory domain-containing protein [Galbibacter pacificus]|uniref:Carboxypeptidase-like regulatory domain-containing protein n=1 Tax=Galbibacter pacificus TaxID=2996052 RepID=A0ABT6FUW7_9FLAO|nr:carboxypeptidase-like regulatory domain-containing protein [Galbibacter pacificus]MDG3583470.1 carboxypeptidase-like regulatory domain-containing protein [Galbibacter pacificus]MDG3587053.1 carboxypeptidase-like regulatory domain-containing protein [Galbibacter pacificus]